MILYFDVHFLKRVQALYHLLQRFTWRPFGIESQVTGCFVAEVHTDVVVVSNTVDYTVEFGILEGQCGVGRQ